LNGPLNPRRKARAIVLQVLYELDLTHHPIWETFANRLVDVDLSVEYVNFARQLLEQTVLNASRLDTIIQQHATELPLTQLAVIDRNILRMALWELSQSPQTPVRVVINEAVELAKAFGSDATASFVNGVLGTLVEQIADVRTQLLTVIAADPTPVLTNS
jgi:N utilization substance protein B